MTVALVLSGGADAGLYSQLESLGVRRGDAAERTGPGLLTVAAAAGAVGERGWWCVGDDAAPEPILARLLAAGGTAAFTGAGRPARWTADGDEPAPPEGGALIVDRPDRDMLAIAAEALAAADAGPVSVDTLVAELARRGVVVRVLDAGPDSEGAVTQLLADPAAQDVARWAAPRRVSPLSLDGRSPGPFRPGRAGPLTAAPSRSDQPPANQPPANQPPANQRLSNQLSASQGAS